MRGCHFHYSQCLWRNIQDKGLTTLYKETTSLRQFFRLLLALPFVRVDCVEDTYMHVVRDAWPSGIARDHPQLMKFMEYYTDYWIDTVPLAAWNVFDMDNHRTNNHVEGMHSMYKKEFGTHSKIWDFIVTFGRLLWHRQLDLAAYIHHGHAPNRPRRNTVVRKEENIAKLRNQYENDEISAFDYINRIAGLFLNKKQDSI